MQDAIKQAEMIGNGSGGGFRRAGDQPDRLSGFARQLDSLENLGAIGPFVALAWGSRAAISRFSTALPEIAQTDDGKNSQGR
jgi:hypothetical protein